MKKGILILGRIKDMIIRGGENIYPKVIEEFLYTIRKLKKSPFWNSR
jgi:fatty-acyl-CoA synthase